MDWIKERVVVDPATGCWIWQKAVKANGYGQTKRHGKNVYAHRLAYEMCHGPIPDGQVVDHLCRNRRCVNPDHLELVSPGENIRRGQTGKGQTMKGKCANGHTTRTRGRCIKCGIAVARV